MIWLFIQLGPIFRFNPLSGNMIRNFFWGDQMAYLSISAAESAGLLKDVEPFTETGRSIYPSGLYALVGWISKLANLQPASALNLAFIIFSIVLVILVAYALRNLFETDLVAFAVLIPLLLGTINTLTTGDWSFELKSHAVIWPMAAGLYTANAESLGLLLISLMSTYLVWRRLHPSPNLFDKKLLWSAVLLGLLANSHTYAFFLGMTIAVVLLLDEAVSTSTRPFAFPRITPFIPVCAIFLAALTLLSGLDVAPLSRLLVLWLIGFVLIGFFANTRHERLRLLLFLITSAVVAAPQIVKLGGAYIAQDAFLTSRQQASGALSVPAFELFFRHLPLILLVFIACYVARRNRSYLQVRVVGLLFFVWLLLSFNQAWGLSQEPYRFAIDAQVPLAIFATATIIAGWRSAFDTRVLKFLGTLSIALIVIPSSLEVQNFWAQRSNLGVIQLDSDQYQEMQSVALLAPRGLLLPDPCIEPAILKVISRKKIAVYSKGLAWPDNVTLVRKVVDARAINVLDLKSVKQLEITALLVDSECPAQWGRLYEANLRRVTEDQTLRYQLYEFRFE